MGEQQGKVVVDLLERGQQPLAPLAVQGRNTAAQGPDRILQIGFFPHQSVMFGLHRNRIFFGPQVNGAQRIALTAQGRNLCLDRVRSGHIVGIGRQGLQQILRRHVKRLSYPRDGRRNQIISRITARFGTGAGLTRFGCQPFRVSFGQACLAQRGFGMCQRLGGFAAARFSRVHRGGQIGTPGRNRGRDCLRPDQFSLGRGFAPGQFRRPFICCLQPGGPTTQLFRNIQHAPRPRLTLSPDLIQT